MNVSSPRTNESLLPNHFVDAIDDPPLAPSSTPSYIDDPRSTPPLPGPEEPFLFSRDSIDSITLTPAEHFRDSVLNASESQNRLDPLGAQTRYSKDWEEPHFDRSTVVTPLKRSNRTRILLAVGGGLIVVIAAVALGIYFGVIRPSQKPRSSATSGSGPSSPKPTDTNGTSGAIVFGGDGTKVKTEDGKEFTYNNKLGGYFVHDPSNPFNNAARAQSSTPGLNETWDYGKDKILGVNLGGWLVIEPFITPALWQKYPAAVDEWTLSTAMAADNASGGLQQLEDHYKTFITEEDFAQIAGAGLNWVRLPIPYWAIDTWDGEPFLQKVCWKYALKAFDWARKYGLRVLLDLHTAPGSQNGYNHSGQFGKVNLLNGVMGIANAQRLLHYIRIFTEFISQPQYKDVIPMFGILNEPNKIDLGPLSNFYIEAHRMIRNITGVGAGNGPYLSVMSGSIDPGGFVGADRIALDLHPYFAFDPTNTGTDVVPFITRTCKEHSAMVDNAQRGFGVTIAGEFSLGGFMLRTPANDHLTKDCTQWDQWEKYTPAMKQDLMSYAMSDMDALQNWFFWTWKIDPNTIDNSPRSPLWSYKLGLENGWIPKNPRDSLGHCASVGVALPAPFSAYQPYQTGGSGAGVINSADLAKFGTWPPTSIGGVANAALLPTYTATGPVPTLPTQTYASATASVDGGNGWFNSADTTPGITTVAGCSYPNAWDATAVAVPATACTGTANGGLKREHLPLPTVAPIR